MEHLHNLYCFAYVVRMTNQMRVRWAGHVVYVGEMGIFTKLWLEKLEGKGHVEDLGIDWRRLCKCMLKKQGDRLFTGFTWCRIGTSGALL